MWHVLYFRRWVLSCSMTAMILLIVVWMFWHNIYKYWKVPKDLSALWGPLGSARRLDKEFGPLNHVVGVKLCLHSMIKRTLWADLDWSQRPSTVCKKQNIDKCTAQALRNSLVCIEFWTGWKLSWKDKSHPLSLNFKLSIYIFVIYVMPMCFEKGCESSVLSCDEAMLNSEHSKHSIAIIFSCQKQFNRTPLLR